VVLADFIRHFSLQSLSVPEIDRFLWKLGKDASGNGKAGSNPKRFGK
jgi:hypothetical protein